jgi:hypothetical protein
MQMSNATFDSRQESFTILKRILRIRIPEGDLSMTPGIYSFLQGVAVFDEANSNDPTITDLATDVFCDVWMRMGPEGF